MLDKVDHWILLRRNLHRLQLDRYRRLAEPGQFLSDFIEFFSRCQDELVSCGDYQRYAEQLAGELEAERPQLDADTLAEAKKPLRANGKSPALPGQRRVAARKEAFIFLAR